MTKIEKLKRIALSRLSSLTSRLFPGVSAKDGKIKCGDIWGRPGKDGPGTGSFELQVQGKWAGKWTDWSTDERGDILDLIRIRFQLKEGDWDAVFDQIDPAWREHPDEEPPTQPGNEPSRDAPIGTGALQRQVADNVEQARKEEDDRIQKRERMERFWGGGDPDPRPLELYLHSRGFNGNDYSFGKQHWGPAPKFSHGMRMPEHNAKLVKGALMFPCLSLHRDTKPHLRIEGLWRIFVNDDFKKTDANTPRAGLCPMKQCVYPFVHNFKPEEWPTRMNHRILLAEGIETTLAWHHLTGYNNACLSCFNSGNIPAVASRLVELANPKTYLNDFRPLVYVAGDNDEAGANAAHKAVNILREGGLEARTIFPPEGYNDANDLLVARRNGDWTERNPWFY